MLALVATAIALSACSKSNPPALTPQQAASAPIPGVTLPPGTLIDLVPTPAEVPAGMVPVVLGSGPRDLNTVASYSGTGAVAAKAASELRAHGFESAYVAQYANQTTGQVLSVVVSRFATQAGAAADFNDDEKGTTGTKVVEPTLGDASEVTTETLPGSTPAKLVLVRFRRGVDTWVLAYKAGANADAALAVHLAQVLLARTAT